MCTRAWWPLEGIRTILWWSLILIQKTDQRRSYFLPWQNPRFLKSPFWSPVTSTTSSSKRQRSTTSLPRPCSQPGPRDPKRGPTEGSPSCRLAGPPKVPPYSENSWAWTFFTYSPRSGCTHYRRVSYTLLPATARTSPLQTRAVMGHSLIWRKYSDNNKTAT